ncbi:unnamed protein product (macronuclear) [Paramecium tetraurelia]|uniref:Uncharacterized protein n=1 Tax=Paramecium tetraurelia TaxID=5888 RepID=A0EBB8_PARTE|nr:uncharacterized protein GSPATT00025319001 [Paramecium tetraurelia]CAK92585.1 unnamed protein product [Paramecium tetraurelia]|eukprot:XP_001459982.1 hypothetical protein (macronuclear) [Paramecium tetraurelia strain d4-2]
MNEKVIADTANSQQEELLSFKEFEKIKFTFTGIDKYIIMELKTSTPLEDLKFRFSSILRTDFFAKRLEYQVIKGFKEKVLSSQKSLLNQGIPSAFKVQGQGLLLNIQVKIIEEGA